MLHNSENARARLAKTIRELFQGLLLNTFLTLLISFGFGSVFFQQDGTLIALPTTADTVWITGLIFGLIMGVLVTRGTVQGFRAAVRAAGGDLDVAPSEAASHVPKHYAWIPKRSGLLGVLVCLASMAISVVLLPTIMGILGIAKLNFFQFIGFITLYSWLLSKLFSRLLVRRMKKADYVQYTMQRHH